MAVLSLALAACGGGGESPPSVAPTEAQVPPPALTPFADGLPAAGHAGGCAVPAAAQLVDTRQPTTVVGDGRVASCTSAAVVAAVAQGGVITFNCGAAPVTITMAATAKVFNNRPDVVLDGGGLVTLSGGGVRRILYQNTCDRDQVWTSPRCDLQTSPTLTLQRITLTDGNATGQTVGGTEVDGGGAVYVRGGQVRVINSRFFKGQTDVAGPDLGGGALRLVGTQSALVVGSTFGGRSDLGNAAANGGAISTLGASLSIYNSELSHNRATGNGANPARPGTPGGGSGGAIYQDGNQFALTLCGVAARDNAAPEGGSAVFHVSNDRSSTVTLTDTVMSGHARGNFETANLPGWFILSGGGQPVLSNSRIVR
jgi:hypothetical protein